MGLGGMTLNTRPLVPVQMTQDEVIDLKEQHINDEARAIYERILDDINTRGLLQGLKDGLEKDLFNLEELSPEEQKMIREDMRMRPEQYKHWNNV